MFGEGQFSEFWNRDEANGSEEDISDCDGISWYKFH